MLLVEEELELPGLMRGPYCCLWERHVKSRMQCCVPCARANLLVVVALVSCGMVNPEALASYRVDSSLHPGGREAVRGWW